jgi:hypothetical protein
VKSLKALCVVAAAASAVMTAWYLIFEIERGAIEVATADRALRNVAIEMTAVRAGRAGARTPAHSEDP